MIGKGNFAWLKMVVTVMVWSVDIWEYGQTLLFIGSGYAAMATEGERCFNRAKSSSNRRRTYWLTLPLR